MADKILMDIEKIYALAMEKGSLGVALRAKELLGRACGIFLTKPKNEIFTLDNISDEDLACLIEKIEKQLDQKQDDKVNTEYVEALQKT